MECDGVRARLWRRRHDADIDARAQPLLDGGVGIIDVGGMQGRQWRWGGEGWHGDGERDDRHAYGGIQLRRCMAD